MGWDYKATGSQSFRWWVAGEILWESLSIYCLQCCFDRLFIYTMKIIVSNGRRTACPTNKNKPIGRQFTYHISSCVNILPHWNLLMDGHDPDCSGVAVKISSFVTIRILLFNCTLALSCCCCSKAISNERAMKKCPLVRLWLGPNNKLLRILSAVLWHSKRSSSLGVVVTDCIY